MIRLTVPKARVASAVVAAVAVIVALAPAAVAAPSPVVTHGYIPMRDGVTLRYSLTRPSKPGRYPVVMVYGPYHSGEITVDWYPNLLRMVGKGFAVVGLNMRGTGCSGGAVKFFDEQQGRDGYDAIEWIARQTWSNGRVGMAGASFEGISQIDVAGQRPPHLAAIAPGQIVGDIYRDIVAPGGVFQGMYVPLYPVLQA